MFSTSFFFFHSYYNDRLFLTKTIPSTFNDGTIFVYEKVLNDVEIQSKDQKRRDARHNQQIKKITDENEILEIKLKNQSNEVAKLDKLLRKKQVEMNGKTFFTISYWLKTANFLIISGGILWVEAWTRFIGNDVGFGNKKFKSLESRGRKFGFDEKAAIGWYWPYQKWAYRWIVQENRKIEKTILIVELEIILGKLLQDDLIWNYEINGIYTHLNP